MMVLGTEVTLTGEDYILDVNVCLSAFLCVCARMRAYMCVYICVCTYVCVTYVCVCLCVCTCMCLCACEYRIAGYFRRVFIFRYFEESFIFENKFLVTASLQK